MTTSLRCRCREEVFPGFSLFIGCRWEFISDTCPTVEFTVVEDTEDEPTDETQSSDEAETSDETEASDEASNDPKPGVVTGVGVLETLDDSFKLHIDGLQLQVDQINKKLEEQTNLIQDYEEENTELKAKLKEMEGLLSGEDMRDVVSGMFSPTFYKQLIRGSQETAQT